MDGLMGTTYPEASKCSVNELNMIATIKLRGFFGYIMETFCIALRTSDWEQLN